MGTYIFSILSKDEIEKKSINLIMDKLHSEYSNFVIKHERYKYSERSYIENDFDIVDINFKKELITQQLDKLIEIIVFIFKNVSTEIEIIGGFNDTENAISQYETDRLKNYRNWNLFASKSITSEKDAYKVNDDIYIYQSFKYDGMGIIFD